MAQASIQLYYDVLSPFGYLAYYTLRNSPRFKNVNIIYTPTFLGGILRACDNRGPLSVKNKDKWVERDRLRWAEAFGIPMAATPPEGFPVSSLAIMRALCVLDRTNRDMLLPATDALYAAVWGPSANKEQVHKPEGLAKVLVRVLGEKEARRVMQEMNGDSNKKALTESVNHAVEEGAFGMPYFVVIGADGQKEAYWGFNYLGMIAEHLGLQRNIGEAGWKAML